MDKVILPNQADVFIVDKQNNRILYTQSNSIISEFYYSAIEGREIPNEWKMVLYGINNIKIINKEIPIDISEDDLMNLIGVNECFNN